MYYNPQKNGNKIDLSLYRFPQYVINYLNYLQVERNLAPGTIVNYANTIQTFLRWMKHVQCGDPEIPLDELAISDISLETVSLLTREDIYEFLSFCANDLDNSAVSRSNKLSALKSFFRYLREVEPSRTVTTNPVIEIASPKKEKPLPKFLTINDAKLLLKCAKQSKNDRDYCILLWFLSCGMRLSELAGLNLRDIKKNGEKVDILIRGKGRKERLVPLNIQCQDALDTYMVRRTAMHPSEAEDAVFLSNRGTRLSKRQIERVVEKYLKKAGLHQKGYNAHLLRHSFASAAFDFGANLLDIGAQLGHQSVASTQRYVHLMRQNRDISDNIGNSLVD